MYIMISFLSKYLPNVVQLGWGGDAGWGTSIFQTLFMTFWSAIFGGILGIIFGVICAGIATYEAVIDAINTFKNPTATDQVLRALLYL